MGLIENKQVKFARVGRFAFSGEDLAEEALWSLSLNIINRGDESKVCQG
jgi:hypothetical protein